VGSVDSEIVGRWLDCCCLSFSFKDFAAWISVDRPRWLTWRLRRGLKPGQKTLDAIGGAHKLQSWPHNILTGKSNVSLGGSVNSHVADMECTQTVEGTLFRLPLFPAGCNRN
jgi:hypothetical protein